MIFETIKKRADILNSRKNAISTTKGKYIFIVFSANEFKKTRFLAVVTKKINKRAVVRNKFRRQIKEIFKQNDLLNGYDYQIIAKNEILDANFWEIKKDIEKCLKNCVTN